MQFDSSLVPDEVVLPEGQYQFIVSKVEARKSKNNHDMLCFTYQVVSDEYQQTIYDYFLLSHAKIGKYHTSKLKHLSAACGVPKWTHESELTNKFFYADVRHGKDEQGRTKFFVSQFTDKARTQHFISTVPQTFSNNDDIPF